MIPPGMEGRKLLVIVDLSWWLSAAFYAQGVEGLFSIVTGWLAQLLTPPAPAMLAFAVDSARPGRRDGLTAHLEPARRYKANRTPRPQAYHDVARRLRELIAAHGIPLLYAEGEEGDDAAATATRLALEEPRLEGTTAVLCTEDKDWTQLVGSRVVCWDGEQRVLGAAAVEACEAHPVPPALVGDLLAIAGDKSDGVAGVPGLGPAKVAMLLRRFGGLSECLFADTLPLELLQGEVQVLDKQRSSVLRKIIRGEFQHEEEHKALCQARKHATEQVQMHKALALLQEHSEQVRLARELVRLRLDAPIAWDPDALPVGGFDAARIRQVYKAVGYTRLAQEVPSFPKPRLEDL